MLQTRWIFHNNKSPTLLWLNLWIKKNIYKRNERNVFIFFILVDIVFIYMHVYMHYIYLYVYTYICNSQSAVIDNIPLKVIYCNVWLKRSLIINKDQIVAILARVVLTHWLDIPFVFPHNNWNFDTASIFKKVRSLPSEPCTNIMSFTFYLIIVSSAWDFYFSQQNGF